MDEKNNKQRERSRKRRERNRAAQAAAITEKGDLPTSKRLKPNLSSEKEKSGIVPMRSLKNSIKFMSMFKSIKEAFRQNGKKLLLVTIC